MAKIVHRNHTYRISLLYLLFLLQLFIVSSDLQDFIKIKDPIKEIKDLIKEIKDLISDSDNSSIKRG
ncbi:hypothetical protein Hanom_Chr10g00962391 [Helianthus anomalus]